MHEAIGILYANSENDTLQGLAEYRPVAAVPYGGRYRLLDFALSSMVNSGLRTIGLITPFLYRPLLDHLGAGKSWFLDRKAGGLFILPGAIHGLRSNNQKFNIKDLKLNFEFLYKDFAENVIISGCNQVFNLHYGEVLEFHEQMNADVTLILVGEERKPEQLLDLPKDVDILIIRRQLLMEMISGYYTLENAELLNVIAENISLLKVYQYSYTGYMKRISSIQDYFKGNMDFLDLETRKNLLLGPNRIHTKIIDNPPTSFESHARVRNSLISSGCVINGEVENSVLSRGVIVEKGAHIKNSIILQKCVIRAEAKLDYVILDKSLEVEAGNILNGRQNHPLMMPKKLLL
ncbi:glucose-1-phosphate adenylyltransferase family protein [Desulfitobacterium metallireducens]|uniref:Glucose-1-phosphate adenylyltransferase n=1 Tax=Desulfitobacterium metallireducens DSM 15288 TaxID=871968 RepID=W0E859_9FIRM|nr:sugar phosphate nucleotidyltransferase [Desulfitobacterium metallireducens]AHF07055.1 glucose-1-phosphate adenylyltransferase [Desulfitobacterium metallireducens DSM 15288]